MWSNFRTNSKTTSRTIRKGESSSTDNLFKGLESTFESLGDTFKDMAKDFEINLTDVESSDRVENDQVAVTVSGGDIDIKGAVNVIKVNGKVIFTRAQEKPKDEAPKDQGK